ncbi:hypothetical protein FKM82_013370 [Ascaphus truei]
MFLLVCACPFTVSILALFSCTVYSAWRKRGIEVNSPNLSSMFPQKGLLADALILHSHLKALILKNNQLNWTGTQKKITFQGTWLRKGPGSLKRCCFI